MTGRRDLLEHHEAPIRQVLTPAILLRIEPIGLILLHAGVRALGCRRVGASGGARAAVPNVLVGDTIRDEAAAVGGEGRMRKR